MLLHTHTHTVCRCISDDCVSVCVLGTVLHNRRTHAHTSGHTDRLTHTHALTHTETVLNARAPLATDNKLAHTHTRKLNTHSHTGTLTRNGSRSGSRSRRCCRSRCHTHTHRHGHGHERRDSATPLRSWHCLALCSRKRQLTAQPETGTPTESVASPKLPARRRWKRTAGTTNPKLLTELRTITERTNIFMQQTIGCPSASRGIGSRSWGC